jgi:hypothetical protein
VHIRVAARAFKFWQSPNAGRGPVLHPCQVMWAVKNLRTYGPWSTDPAQRRWCDAKGAFIIYVAQPDTSAAQRASFLYAELLSADDLEEGEVTVLQRWGRAPWEEGGGDEEAEAAAEEEEKKKKKKQQQGMQKCAQLAAEAAAALPPLPPPAPRVRAGSPPPNRRSRKRLLGILKKRDVRAKLSVGRCR